MNDGLTIYDKVAHLMGMLALGLITVAGAMSTPDAAGVVHNPIPGWLMIVASVIAFATGATTKPVMNRPTVGEAVEKAKIGVVLLLGLSLGLTACTKNPPGAPPTPAGTFGHCTTDAIRTASQGILGEVTTALVTGDYVGELNKLAVTFGTAEVGCAVDLVIAEFRAKAARSDDTEVAVVLVHAQAWRLSNP